ncbi:MAG: hypothetical protein ACXAD7_21710 [Candidatus Kariarchaeaceae archaeon]|jgi:ABC-type transport system involved in multi-copper enzyme maturation permease subunit
MVEKLQNVENNDTDYLQRFGYRLYDGETQGRKSRILSIIIFELKSTWHRSTFGKVLLIIILFFNVISLGVAATVNTSLLRGVHPTQKDEATRDVLHAFVASFLNFGGGNQSIQSGTIVETFEFQMNLGILLIALFSIAGSGFFADDKQGKVIEIYLSRLQKKEYVIGKIGGILLYINIFLGLPLLIAGALYVQAFDGINHFEAWDFYLGVIIYSFLVSLIVGLAILCFSIILEKRQYASLGFFLMYVLGSIIGYAVIGGDADEKLYLISPSFFFALLAYVCFRDFNLGISTFEGFENDEVQISYENFYLDDGGGLEYWHILFMAFSLIFLMSAFLSYKIRKMTTEEL